MSELDDLMHNLGGGGSPPAPAKPKSELDHIKETLGNIGHAAGVFGGAALQGLGSVPGYVLDVAQKWGEGVDQETPMQNEQAKGLVHTIAGGGPMAQASSDAIGKAAHVAQPRNELENVLQSMGMMAGAGATGLGEAKSLGAAARIIGKAAGTGAAIYGAQKAFPDNDYATIAAGILAHGGLHALTRHLEGGGTEANPLTSPKGAMGPMQVMPETARNPGFGIKPWDGKTQADLTRVGEEYDDALNKKYAGDTQKVLAAYNDGPGAVDKLIAEHGDEWAQHLPLETKKYLAKAGMWDGKGGSVGMGVPPMDPADISAAMGQTPEEAATLAEPSEPGPLDSTEETPPPPLPQDNPIAQPVNPEAPSNVTNLDDVREQRQGAENDSLIADNDAFADKIHSGIDQGMITEQHIPNITDARDNLVEARDQYQDVLNDTQHAQMQGTIDKLNDAITRLGGNPKSVAEDATAKYTQSPEQVAAPTNDNTPGATEPPTEPDPPIGLGIGFGDGGIDVGQGSPAGGEEPPSDPEDKYHASINLDRMAISDKAKDWIRNNIPADNPIKTFPEQQSDAIKYINEHGIEGVLNRQAMPREEVNTHDMATHAIAAASSQHLADIAKAYEQQRFEGRHDPILQARLLDATDVAAKAMQQHNEAGLYAGRGLGSRRIMMSGHNGDLTAKLDELLRNKGDADKIAELINRNPEQAGKIARDLQRPGASDIIFSTWYSFLLSALKTPMRFFMGSTMMHELETASSFLGAGVGAVRKGLGIGSDERMTFREAAARQTGFIQGVANAFKAYDINDAGTTPLFQNIHSTELSETAQKAGKFRPIAEAYRQGKPLDFVDRAQAHYVPENKGLGRIIGEPLRNVGAHDELMRHALTFADQKAMANRIAAREGLTGQAFDERVNDLMQNPTNEMWKSMVAYGRYGRLQDDMQWKGLQTVTKISATDTPFVKVMKSLAKVLCPFPRLADRKLFGMLRYSPLSVLEPKNLADLKAGGARADHAVGRILLSYGIAGGIAYAASKGYINGPNDREHPMTIRIGNTYIGMENVLHTVAPVAGAIADLVNSNMDGKSLNDRMAQHLIGIGKMIGDDTYARGVQNLFTALDDHSGKQFQHWAGKTAASFLSPAIVSDTNKNYTDPTVRDTNQNPYPDEIKAAFPGLSNTLPAKHNGFGDVITRQNPLGLNAINPTQIETVQPGVEQDMDSLSKSLGKPVVTAPSKTVTINGQKVRLSEQGFQKYQQASGQIFKQSLQDNREELRQMSTTDKAAYVKDLLRNAREQARAQLWSS